MTQEILQYKGYYGSVNFSAEDKCFFGKIILIGNNDADLVSFEGLTLVHLKSAFEKAVDSYLQACLELNKEPHNVLQYNKMCAEFLGAIYSENASAWGFGKAKKIGSKKFNGIVYRNVVQAERFEKELKFHYDWNWIMEVVNKIQILEIVHDYERSYDSVFKEYQCAFSPAYKTHDFGLIVGVSKSSEKEAVMDAINQFLIWYEKNKI
jgi:predicted HicB family RNase H-like nuclease